MIKLNYAKERESPWIQLKKALFEGLIGGILFTALWIGLMFWLSR